MNKHSNYDLQQLQSLSLEDKIKLTKQRIKDWYESWCEYTIVDTKTGKTRTVTFMEEPNKNGFFKKSNSGGGQEHYQLIRGTRLKDTEYIESYKEGQVYTSFSGGKDSTVLKHIIDSMYGDVPSVFVNTGLEYPEIQSFVKEIMSGKYDCFNNNIKILKPKIRFDEVIKTYGYPVASKEISKKIYYARQGAKWAKKYIDGTAEYNGKSSRYSISKRWLKLLDAPFQVSSSCCDVIKKAPIKQYELITKRKGFIGMMADESAIRQQAWMRTGCNAFESTVPKSSPMAFWTEQDVLEYITKYNVPYATVYGNIIKHNNILSTTGVARTGCMFCMFGCHLEKEPNKFQQMKISHPKQYDYCMKSIKEGGLGLKDVLDYINVKYD